MPLLKKVISRVKEWQADSRPASDARKGQVRRIIVSSNCQTGGVAAALQEIFPDDVFMPIPLPTLSGEEEERNFVGRLEGADIWVSNGLHELLDKYGLNSRVQLVRIPRIRFSGFHPDLVYAKQLSTNKLIDPHYNSAIVVWSYKNNIEIQKAKTFFNAENYWQLGYMSSWEPCVAGLKQLFKDTDVDFSEFFLGVRREGLFMYSLNHPKVQVLARLAKLIALRMGANKAVLEKRIDIDDGLNEIIWPLYPELGDELALPSAYEWKVENGKWLIGVEAYLEFAYANYTNQGIRPDDLEAVGIDKDLYDRVLGSQAGAMHG